MNDIELLASLDKMQKYLFEELEKAEKTVKDIRRIADKTAILTNALSVRYNDAKTEASVSCCRKCRFRKAVKYED